MKNSRGIYLCLILCVAFMLCSCAQFQNSGSVQPASSGAEQGSQPTSGTAVQPETPAQPGYFVITLDDLGRRGVVVNHKGQEIMRGDMLEILYDKLTGLPQVIMQLRVPGKTADEEWNIDDYEHCEAALYNLEGKLLFDWAPGLYHAGFGEYIIQTARQVISFDLSPKGKIEGVPANLIDMQSGDVVLEGAYGLQVLSGGRMAVFNGAVYLGIINEKLEKLAGFPMARPYYGLFESGAIFLADAAEPHPDGEIIGYVLDSEFQEQQAYPGWQLTPSDVRGAGCLQKTTYGEGENAKPVYELLDAATGKLVQNVSSMGLGAPTYYDGKIMLNIAGQTPRDTLMEMNTAGGGALLWNYSSLYPVAGGQAKEADLFFGCSSGSVMLANSEGELLARSDISSGRAEYYGPDSWYPLAVPCIVSFGVMADKPQDGEYAALLDMDLKTIVPYGKYRNILPVTECENGDVVYKPTNYLAATQNTNVEGKALWDILDTQGNILLADLEMLYTFSTASQCAVVQKDGCTGLLGLDGNWLWVEKTGS